MMNKKTIAIATAAMSVAGAVVPVFADYDKAVQKDDVNVRTAKGRALEPRYIHETDLDEYFRANAAKNPKKVGKIYSNGKAYYAVEIDMDMTVTANKDAKAAATQKLNKLKLTLENMKKEQYNGKARYTFEVRDVNASIVDSSFLEDGHTDVYVTDNKDASAKVEKYVFTGSFEFVENDVVDVKKESVDLTNSQGYKDLAKYVYQIETKAGKIHVTTSLGNENLILNIYRTDKKILVGQLTIEGYNIFNKSIYNKYAISAKKSDFAGHWAQNDIIDAMHNGQVVLSSNFRPKDAVTRAEFAKMVVNVNGLKMNNTTNVKFTDVQKENWFYNDIMVLASNGYINGYTDGTFKPNATITRQEAAAILASIEGIKETFYTDLAGNKIHTDIVTRFADDKSIAAWADQSVEGLANVGVIKGYKENGKEYFKPANKVDRAEALVMAQRVTVR